MNEKVRSYILKAYAYAKQAFARCFEDKATGAPADRCAALAMAAACTAQYSAAAAVYLSECKEPDQAVLRLFRCFEIVAAEVRTVYHQAEPNATSLFFAMSDLEAAMSDNGFLV